MTSCALFPAVNTNFPPQPVMGRTQGQLYLSGRPNHLFHILTSCWAEWKLLIILATTSDISIGFYIFTFFYVFEINPDDLFIDVSIYISHMYTCNVYVGRQILWNVSSWCVRGKGPLFLAGGTRFWTPTELPLSSDLDQISKKTFFLSHCVGFSPLWYSLENLA